LRTFINEGPSKRIAVPVDRSGSCVSGGGRNRLTSAFGSLDGIGYTLFYATPLIFTGLAVAVAFKCGLLNIGAEGQLIAAAFATAWVGLVLPGPP
jgi:ABC-type uncharacterized transport system permease subunit